MVRSSRMVWGIVIVTLVICAILVTDVVSWVRGDVPWTPVMGRWVWDYSAPRWAWVLPAIAGAVIYVWGAQRTLRAAQHSTAYPIRLMLWAFCGAALLPLLLLTLEGNPRYLLFTRSVSVVTGGYPYAAAMIDDGDYTTTDWPDFVRHYRDEMNMNPPGGVVLSPPGLVMVYQAINGVFYRVPAAADAYGSLLRPLQCQNLDLMTWDDSEMAGVWLQILMPFWAALAIVPLYRLGVLVFDVTSARLAVALWPLLPGMAVFQPRFNVFYPLITVVMLWLLWQGMVRARGRWIIASGGVLSLGMFFNISLIPLGLLAGLTLIGYRGLIARATWRRLPGELLAFGAGCASIWLGYWAVSGETPWGLIEFLLNQHDDLYRPYWPWLVMHPYDMFLFVGIPVALLALWRIGIVWARQNRAVEINQGDVLALAIAITLSVLVLSGTARGETGRVWLFFAPVWVLLAANILRRFDRRRQGVLLVCQAICLLSIAAVLRPNFTAFTVPPRPAEAAAAPSFPTNVRFESGSDVVTLVGLSVAQAPGEIRLHLHWRAEARVKRPYVLSLLSIAPDGSPGESVSWNPLGWEYPPSCWTPGRAFVDTVTVSLGEDAMAGDWLFSLSIQDVFTHDPMQVIAPDGSVSQQHGIGPVNVQGSAVQ